MTSPRSRQSADRTAASACVAATLALASFLAGCATTGQRPGEVEAPPRWFRGNVHTHTLWSDGDVAPELAIDWYVRHGYDFLVLSDHNILQEGDFWSPVGDGWKQARPDGIEALRARFGDAAVRLRTSSEGRQELRLAPLGELRERFERPGSFLLIVGEEISDVYDGRPIHHGALNVERAIEPPGGATVPDLLRRTLQRIEDEGRRTGRPTLGHLNHPNYEWGVTPEEIAEVHEERFFEVYNGHRLVRNEGDADHPSTERLWDEVLTARRLSGGPLLYGLATDDAHDFLARPDVSNPGRGWLVVQARELSADAIVTAMRRGDFYASTGVRLREVRADGRKLVVKVDPEPGVAYTVRFVGTRRPADGTGDPIPGELLAEGRGRSARYRFRGDEMYVRAVVVSDRVHPNGYAPGDLETAWVQPVVPGTGR